MSNRIGLIGPEDSIQRMEEVGSSFSHLTFHSFCYQEAEEILGLIQSEPEIDFWLFSGPVPYDYVIRKGVLTKEQALYTPLIGSSLTSTLLQAVIHRGLKLDRISFDTYKEEEIKEVFAELDFTLHHIEVLPFCGYIDIEKLVAFHRDHYQRGTSDFAITCIRSVYQQLTNENIPVLRVIPTRMIIRQTMTLLQQKIETAHYIQSSIAVIALEFAWQPNSYEDTYSYDFRQQQLNVEGKLLTYAKSVDGSLIRIGDVSYFIFTTRGVLDDLVNTGCSIQGWLQELYHLTQFKAYAGVGYGQSVFDAEKNSRRALQFAKQYQPMSTFLVTEEGEVQGPLTDADDGGEAVSYSLRKQEGTPSQWLRVKAYLKKYGKNEVTAHELAMWMNVTTRSARRILSELEEAGLAHIVGEEQPGPKGRPRKLYRIVD